MKKKNPPVILSQAALIFTEYQDGKKKTVGVQVMGSGDAVIRARDFIFIISDVYEKKKRQNREAKTK